MLSLSYEEINRLQIILIEHCRSKSPRYLESLIINSKIEQKNLDINYYLPAPEWVEIIQSELSKSYSLDGNLKRLDFILFLEYFQFKLAPESDERLFITDIINKIEKSPIFESQSQINNIKNLLVQERQEQSELPTIDLSNISQRIDKTLIVNHDLEDLEKVLNEELGFRGTFAFSISSPDTNISRDYIIERILHKLKQQTGRSNYIQEFNLFDSHLSLLEDIEQDLKSRKICNAIVDLPSKNPKLNIVIILWNFILSSQILNKKTNGFLEGIKKHCRDCLRKNRQCLIIILADNSLAYEANGFKAIKTPEKFILDGKKSLVEWFGNELSKLNIKESQINYYIGRIKRQNGHLIGTYQVIQRIIDELNRRILNNG